MRTNIVLDDSLVKEAFKYAKDIHTKRALIETALIAFVQNRKMKDFRDLKEPFLFDEGYDYTRSKMKPGFQIAAGAYSYM